ncbi:Uncharacterised protein [Mycobacterium tuberculosis]|uniref:Uncharacterized protein n=1 Tax=Mycobacterium tuberculosis TaxID=1773 RepID=A0A655JSC7_MYCTX|nr:Uncharacterised protein [Mycobacterium tuberculosis]COX68699.1 Uncharacterised protein [Mycobacterium tuberculosis]
MLRNSSTVQRRPSSSTTTSRPARASVRATIAPPAPEPTTTASALVTDGLSADKMTVNSASGRAASCSWARASNSCA